MSTILDDIISGEEANKTESERIEKAKVLKSSLTEIQAASERMKDKNIVAFTMEMTKNNILKTRAVYENGQTYVFDYPCTYNLMNQGIESLISIYIDDLNKQIDEL